MTKADWKSAPGYNKRMFVRLLPGIVVAIVLGTMMMKPYRLGHGFSGEPLIDPVAILELLCIFAIGLLFLIITGALALKRRFTLVWAGVYLSVLTCWWIPKLPFPGFTDGMKSRLQQDVPEKMMREFAADATRLHAEKPEMKGLELQTALMQHYPELSDLSDFSSRVWISQGDVFMEWSISKGPTFGICISPNGKNFDPLHDQMYYQNIRSVYPRVWVYHRFFSDGP